MRKINHSSLRHQVYEEIKNSILNGHCPPGEEIVEKELVETLGVSRTPLREVFRMLEVEGLLTRVGSKYRVYIASWRDTEELYYCRAALEGLAARILAENKTKLAVTQLDKCIEKAREKYEQGDVEGVIAQNSAFHNLLIEYSKNDMLKKMLESVSFRIQQQRNSALRIYERYNDFLKEHQQILDAVKAGDAPLAQELVYNHIMRDKEAISKKEKIHQEQKE